MFVEPKKRDNMVGLVFVSHSAELAAATKALAEQQTQGRAAIAAVGGTGDLENPFGTDAMAILEAIQSVYHDDGVLVLMDLGSAIMSAETALEFMDPDQAARVRLSAGPFVEGAMAASVQASIGMDLEAVAAEAAEAMRPKMESLGVPAGLAGANLPEPAAESRPSTGEAGISATVTLVNHAGLHFGPAVLFVQTAAASQAEITARNLSTGAGPANAKRFNQVLSLGRRAGPRRGDHRPGTGRTGGTGCAGGTGRSRIRRDRRDACRRAHGLAGRHARYHFGYRLARPHRHRRIAWCGRGHGRRAGPAGAGHSSQHRRRPNSRMAALSGRPSIRPRPSWAGWPSAWPASSALSRRVFSRRMRWC